MTVCPASPEVMNTRVGAPAAYLEQVRTGKKSPDAASIVVDYTGFTPQAQAAFQYAVDIWQSLLTSPVTVHVKANWTPLASGVLGSAGAAAYYTRVDGAPKIDVQYPVALAEKIAGRDLNAPGDPDINANFSSTFNWYLGTDGNTPAGQYDLVSVVLHELGHGLGFIAGASYTAPQGSFTNPPFVFATYIENTAGQQLTDTRLFPNPSTALGTQLRSNALYFNSPLAIAANGSAGRPRLYAPTTYSAGSSISHLNEATYLAGNINSLMTPQIGSAEAIHTPGPLTLAMFAEMGWFNTAIRHTPLRDSELAQNFVITATVVSDGTITPGSVKLNYTIDGGAATTVVMTATSTPNQYAGTIPNPGLNTTISYYLSASDNETGRVYTAPGVYQPGVTTLARYTFRVGRDTQAPVLVHQAPAYILLDGQPYQLTVVAKDNLGINTVAVEYSVNGTVRPSFNLTQQNDTTFVGAFTAGGALSGGDIINYRLVARDVATIPNQTASPGTGLFTVPVVAFKAPVTTYTNDFNTNSALDFVGAGFSITQPTGFTNPAIHSDHPYKDGTGANSESNIIYQMLVPIIVKSAVAEATVRFDEIALVEPNDAGAVFGGAGFYDYVIVEGSNDGGTTWTRLVDGYNARANANWLAVYNSGTSGYNSTGVGTPSLFASRTINLRDRFAAGDVVRLRFRLFSDELAHGWGWAIDNLSIQPVVQSTASELKAGGLSIYPNPSTGQFTVAADLSQPTQALQLVVRNVLGQEVLRQPVAAGQRALKIAVDLSSLKAGLYQVSLGTDGDFVSRKVLVQK